MSNKTNTSTNSDDLWLEEIEGEKALAWANQQSEKTKSELMSFTHFDEFKSQSLEILLDDKKIPDGFIRGGFVYNLWQDRKHVQGLLRRAELSKYQTGCQWESVLDLDLLSADENEKWVFKGINLCHEDDSRALITISRGGKDASETREFDLKTKEFLADGFFLPEGKNTLEWIDRDQLLVGTDFDDQSRTTSGYVRKLKIWQRGESLDELKAKPVFFEMPEQEMGCWVYCQEWSETKLFLINQVKSFYANDYYWVNFSNKTPEANQPAGPAASQQTSPESKPETQPEIKPQTKKLHIPEDAEVRGWHKNQVIVHLCSDWKIEDKTFTSDSVLSASIETLCQAGGPKANDILTIFEASDDKVYEQVVTIKDGILLATLQNVIGEVEKFSFANGQWQKTQFDFPVEGQTQIRAASSDSETFVLSNESFTTPTKFFRCTPQKPAVECYSLDEKFNTDGVEVEQRWATSADGTKVPYFIVGKNLKSGPAPTLQYGYGGFQAALTQSYAPTLGRLWLERGARYAFTNIRGGGEFGPKWHQSSLKLNRHKCYEDFAAISEQMISDEVTTSEQLAISGGSNGGLLVGAMLTRRPDLYKAVLCDVPLLDMIRYTKLLAGASWSAEYGDPDESEEIRNYLLSYSPYHNVHADKKYPRSFFYTSTKDDRVHPGHARRMAAKMISQNHSVLYLENTDGGHGRTVDPHKTAEWTAMRYSFLWKELSV